MNDEIQILDNFGEVLKTYSVPLGNTQFEKVCWEGIDLFGAQLNGANFRDAVLYWGSFVAAQLNDANFENANLQGAVLVEASCVRANFRSANLGRDNLGGSSQLQGADLTAAILEGTRLKGAEYDERTKFPKGFDPKSHGMIKRAV